MTKLGLRFDRKSWIFLFYILDIKKKYLTFLGKNDLESDLFLLVTLVVNFLLRL